MGTKSDKLKSEDSSQQQEICPKEVVKVWKELENALQENFEDPLLEEAQEVAKNKKAKKSKKEWGLTRNPKFHNVQIEKTDVSWNDICSEFNQTERIS